MKIYSMTATFGKLEHETLRLEPGLNIIDAPNEWGKSTWCAFLVSILYGIDTRARTVKGALADKERYQPWAGSPMSGRMDICWNGRDITIERRSKGRIPFGEFRAYETATGMDVPELNAANCGQVLLGVEKNVFTRAGFLKLTDLPVTQDDALRRRLNALVTTGDESNAGDTLAQTLKDLKNRCRYNRSGLLPQAEAELATLQGKYAELQGLVQQASRLQKRQTEVENHLESLRNHQTALRYQAAREDAGRVDTARRVVEAAQKRVTELTALCSTLPSRAEADQAVSAIRRGHQQWQALQMEEKMLPAPPEAPTAPLAFQGLDDEQAAQLVSTDTNQYHALLPQLTRRSIFPWILAALLFAAGIGAFFISKPIAFGILGAAAVALITAIVLQISGNRQKQRAMQALKILCSRYGSNDPNLWESSLQEYREAKQVYTRELTAYQQTRGDLDQRIRKIQQAMDVLAGDTTLQERLVSWLKVLETRNNLEDAQRDLQLAKSHASAAQAMAATAPPPAFPDALTYSEAETARLISDANLEQRQLQMQLGQCQGRMDAIGASPALKAQIDAVQARIHRLEETYSALEIAQNTLAEATSELQRRFAPKISARAEALFAALTDNRYERLILGEDLSLSAAAKQEDTVRPAFWRSDGTVDQQYLALRLAVAEELTPDAPLVLDDALVRFDDQRLAAALSVLRESAQNRQVLLFTCQSRERQILNA